MLACYPPLTPPAPRLSFSFLPHFYTEGLSELFLIYFFFLPPFLPSPGLGIGSSGSHGACQKTISHGSQGW